MFAQFHKLNYTAANEGKTMKKICLLSAFSFLLGACAATAPAPEQTLAQIYADAYGMLDKEKYNAAAAEFLRAESQFPSSPWAADSLVMAAYSQYMDDDFAGALLAADRFMRFHPGHRDVPYILYLRGMCYYRQVSDVRREPGMSVYALQQFQQLDERFPNSEYAENARNKIVILKNYIAGKAMYMARDDMRAENWPSAINRLQSVVSGAQETAMTPEALYRLTEAYAAIGLPEQAAGYGEMLKLNYPDNEWTKKLK
jgi:outer membrane protein assembly factor BamD